MNKKSVFKRVVSTVLSLSMVLSYIDIDPIKDLTSLVMNASADDTVATLTKSYYDDNFDNSDSQRVFLWDKASGSFGGINQTNEIHVFAFEGETICVGSNVYNSNTNYNKTQNKYVYSGSTHNNEGSIDILMTDESNNVTTIDVIQNGEGYIGDYATEHTAKTAAKMSDYGDDYTPYKFPVTKTGIYTFNFRSYSGSGSADDTKAKGYISHNVTKKMDFGSPAGNPGLIAAWDISVFNEAGNRESGRTYADYLAVQTSNKTNVKERYWIVTTDSYIYEMTFVGTKPYTYNFFANNQGILDGSNILYKSVKDIDNGNHFDRMGVTYKYPGTKPTDISRSFYIFFEKPDVEDLTGYLFDKPELPDPATNLKFVSTVEKDGDMIPGAYEGMGGYFSFDVGDATTASIVIEFKVPGYEYAPVELSGAVVPNTTNYLYWDGRDGNGVVLPARHYKFDEISYKVTAKSGEIHFPIFDMEEAAYGMSFTRVSNLYNAKGEQIDDEHCADNMKIYNATRSVIYYDDTAIYYGEKVVPTAELSEANVDAAKGNFTTEVNGGTIYNYANYASGGERTAYNTYGQGAGLRVGDHSHTSNAIDYSSTYAAQSAMIDYLDSVKNPVGKATGTTVTDYGIANYWTFTPSVTNEPAEAIQNKGIEIISGDDVFNLNGRVFFDEDGTNTKDTQTYGVYNESTDRPLADVGVELYKKVDKFEEDKNIFSYDEAKGILTPANNGSSTASLYELISSEKTLSDGQYTFIGIPYDKESGTEFLYHVISPDDHYTLTSGERKGAVLSKTYTYNGVSAVYKFGYYYSHVYDETATGKEFQKIKVGGDGGLTPPAKGNPDNKVADTIAAIDVGYYYALMSYDLELKKTWDNATTTASRPQSVFYEVSYLSKGESKIYDVCSISSSDSWINNTEFNHLPSEIDGDPVDDYYVSAEYYIYNDKIFKHVFKYNPELKKYESFIGSDKYYDTTKEIKSISDIDDLNGDGSRDGKDLIEIKDWKDAKPAGTVASGTDVAAPYSAVLDRNFTAGSPKMTISITNSGNPATVEIFKYHDDMLEANALDGATFRIYEGTMSTIQALVNAGNIEELSTLQRGSGTTRANGRIAFPGLNPSNTYTVREVYAPTGYKKTVEYYEIRPQGEIKQTESGLDYLAEFDTNNHCTINIPNSEAVSGFYIRKRILGRAWIDTTNPSLTGHEDSFSFTMKMDKVEPENSEVTILSLGTFDALQAQADDFIKKFNALPKVTITSESDYSVENKLVSANTKISKPLLTDSSTNADDPAMIRIDLGGDALAFPAAGKYTLTVTEDDIPKGNKDDGTITKSNYEYQVVIDVTRQKDKGADESEELTKNNSHLVASVSEVKYKADAASPLEIYGGSFPLFTNTYEAALLNQYTSYYIEKNFTGRVSVGSDGEKTKDIWLDDDEKDAFSFNISGGDANTTAAIGEGHLKVKVNEKDVIDKDNPTATLTISEKDKDGKYRLKIDEIDFSGTEFPVRYHNSKDETDIRDTITEEEKATGDYVPRTDPVVYVLNFNEVIPEGAEKNIKDGITYDSAKYTLTITLKNAVNADGIVDGIIDGIIDSVDLVLTKEGQKEPVSQCHSEYSVDAVTGDIIVTESSHTGGSGKNAPEFIKAHTMTFSNKYNVAADLTLPKIVKIISGRNWDTHDKFDFSVSLVDPKDDGSVTLPGALTITDASDNKSDTEKGKIGEFGPVKFTEPGKYTLTVSEIDGGNNGFEPDGAEYTIEVEVTDDNKGALTAEITKITDKNGDNMDSGSEYLSFTNNYTDNKKEIGLIQIAKTLEGRSWAEADKFEFLFVPDTETKDAIDAGSIVLPGDFVPNDTGDGSYIVTLNGNDAVPVGQTLTKALGKIIFTKGGESTLEYSFTISEIKGSAEIDYSSETHTVNIQVDRERSTESDNRITGNLNVKISLDTEDFGESVTVPFTNAAYAKNKDLQVVKSVFGSWNSAKYTVDIKRTDTNGHKVKIDETEIAEGESATITLTKVDPDQIPEIKFYEVGEYEFTVKEVKPSEPGAVDYDETVYTVTATVTDEAGKLAAVYNINGKPGNEVKFENVSVGSLSVTKTVKSNSSTVTPPNKDFKFTVELTLPKDTDGQTLPARYLEKSEYSFTGGAEITGFDKDNRTFTVEFTLKAGEKATINNLPTGTAYIITETPVFGFKQEENDKLSGTINVGTDPAVNVEVINTYNVNDITISKKVQNEVGTDISAYDSNIFNFDITLTDDNGNPLDEDIYENNSEKITWLGNGKGTFTITPKESITLKNIPYGAKYSIKETGNYAGYVKKEAEVSKTVDEKDQKAVLVNTKLNPYDLIIKKTVESSMAADHEQDFKFDVTLTAPEDTVLADSYTVTGAKETPDFTTRSGNSLKTTITIHGSASATIYGLPNGTKYTVTETNGGEKDERFAPVNKEAEGYVTTQNTDVEIVNRRESGSLTIIKTVESIIADNIDKEELFKFTIKIDGIKDGDYKITDSAETVKFKNGEATLQLKDGERATIENLPDGAAYTVTEAEVNNEKYFTFVGSEQTNVAKGNIDPKTPSEVEFFNVYNNKPIKELTDKDISSVQVGDKITYSITWYNNSKNSETVIITDALPDCLEPVDPEKAIYEYNKTSNTVTWTLNNCDPLSSGTVTLEVRVNEKAAKTGFENSATVTVGEGEDKQEYSISSKHFDQAEMGEIRISKKVVGSLAEKDKYFTFTITGAKDKTGVKLTGKYDYTDDKGNKKGTFDFQNANTFKLKDGESIIVKLPVGANLTVKETEAEGYTTTITVQGIDAEGKATILKESSEKIVESGISYYPVELTVSDSDKYKYTEAAFTNRKDGANEKRVDRLLTNLQLGNSVYVGDKITYVIKWNNNNEYDADVTIIDHLPDGIKAEKSKEYEYDETKNTVTWTLTDKKAGESGEVRLTVEVTEAAAKLEGGIINTADIIVDDVEGGSTTDTVSADAVYVLTGSVSISKTLEDPGNTAGADTSYVFDITATYKGEYLTGKYTYKGEKSGELDFGAKGDGTVSIELLKNQEITIIGLPTDTVLNITERAMPGYKVRYEYDGDTNYGRVAKDIIVPMNTAAAVTFVNTKLEEHDLSISKVVAGKDGDRSREWKFDVELTAPDGTIFASEYAVDGGTVSWGPLTDGDTKLTGRFSLVSGGYVTIKGLPEGTVYDVIEKELPENYQVSANVSGTAAILVESDDPTVTTAKLSENTVFSKPEKRTLDANKDIKITNESPIPETGEGRFSLTKKVTGVGLKDADINTEWHFDLQFENMGEKDYDYIKQDVLTHEIEEGVISVGKDGEITSIKVKDPSGMSFTTQDTTKITLKDSESITIYRLKAGEIVTVSEVEGNQNGYATKFDSQTAPAVKAASIAAPAEYRAAIPDKSEVTVTCTNELQPGELHVSSDIVDEGGTSIKDNETKFEFDITLTREDGTPFDNDFYKQFEGISGIEWEIVDGRYTGNGKMTGREFNLSGLPRGTKYTVKEHLAPGYSFRSSSEYSGTIAAGGTSSANFVNTKLGEATLEVTKLIESRIASDSTKPFTINIKLTAPADTILADTYYYTVSPSAEYTGDRELNRISGTTTWESNFNLIPGQTATIKGLPRGTRFILTEPSASEDGFDPDISPNNTSLAEGKNAVTITNIRKTADLTISKTISPDSGLTETDKAVPFKFEIVLAGTPKLSIADIDGTYEYDGTYSGTVTFSGGKVTASTGAPSPFGNDGKLALKHNESIKINGLPVGTGYTVTEAQYSGYTPDAEEFSGNIDESSGSNHAEFINNKKVGTLTISKQVVHSDGGAISGGSTEDDFVFDVYMYITLPDKTELPLSGTFGDHTFVNGRPDTPITLKNGESAVFTDIPLGTHYDINEDLSGKEDVYACEVIDDNASEINGSKVSGDIKTSAAIQYINTKNVASLTVTKTVENDNANIKTKDSNKYFSFTLTLKNSHVSVAGTYKTDKGEITIDDGGVGAFMLKDGERLTIYGIPTGISYTVAETACDDYNVKINDISDEDGSSEGTISSDSTVAFTNVKKSAELWVTKEINSTSEITADDKLIPFSFTIELEAPVNDGTKYIGLDGTVSAVIDRANGGTDKLADLVFTEGSCSDEIILFHGDTVKLTGIPMGTRYTVTEVTEDPGYASAEENGNISGIITTGTEERTFRNNKVSDPLTIVKTVVNSDGTPLSKETAEEKFDFAVKFTDDGITFSTAKVSINGEAEVPLNADADGKLHVQLGDGDSAVFTDIPLGTHYEISEDLSDKDGYDIPEVTDDNASEITDGNDIGQIKEQAPIRVEYINKKNVGSLTVTNTVQVSGSDDSELNDNDMEPFEFSIELGSKARAAAGYENEYSAYIGEKGSSSAGAANALVSFNDDGTLKSVTYNGSVESSVKLSHNMEITIYGIPLDMGYKVTEKPRPGYTISVDSDNGFISTANAVNYINIRYVGKFTLAKNVEENGNSINDTFDKTKTFKFDLTLFDADSNAVSGTFKALRSGGTSEELTFVSGQYAGLELHAGESITISGLPDGAAITAAEAAESSAGYTVKVNDEPSADGKYSGTIAADSEVNAVFTNSFNTADIYISKTVENYNAAEDSEAFTFEISADGNTGFVGIFDAEYTAPAIAADTSMQTAAVTFTGGIANITLYHGQTVTIKGIPADVKFTVKEINIPDKYDEQIISEQYLDTGTNGIHSAAFINKKKTGTLDLTKIVTGDETEGQFNINVTFSGTGDLSGIKLNDGEFTGQVTLENGGTAKFTGIPYGTSFYVEEAAESSEGYTVTYLDTSGAENDGEGTINSQNVSVTVFNTKNIVDPPLPDTGSLTLTKHINILSGTPDPEDTFTFSITLVYPDTTSDTREVVLHGEESTVIGDIPVGTTYTISEAYMPYGYTAATDPITKTVTGDNAEIFVNNFGSSTDPEEPTPPPADPPEKEEDPPEPPKPVDLIIHKDVVDENGNDINSENNDSFEFVVEIFRMNGDYALGSFEYTGTMGSSGSVSSGGKITLKAGETVTIEEIPAGYGYRIREVTSESGEYKVNGSDTISGTLVDHRANTVDFENRYIPEEKPEDPDKSTGEDPDDTDSSDPDNDVPDDTEEPDGSYESANSGASASSEEEELPDDDHKSAPEYPDDAEEAKEPEELEAPDETDADSDIPYEPEAQENPKTGNTSPASAIFAVIASAAAMLFSRKKKK